MKSIRIGDQELNIKDYLCSSDGIYGPKQVGKLWLYVNLTDICNGSCPFCINPAAGKGTKRIDPSTYRDTLEKIKDHVYGVSITGGEPMLYPELVNEILCITREICGKHVEKDLVTNGTGFADIFKKLDPEQLDSVHLSRHRIADEDNDRVFGFPTATAEDIAAVIEGLEDPAQIVLNCVLMAGGTDSLKRVRDYLEFASVLGVRNVCFIGLSRHNAFCEENYTDPERLGLTDARGFHIWNRYQDHEYCCCSSGSYDSRNGSIRFYYRSMGAAKPPFARQLVYTADDRLLAGFSGKEIHL